MGSGSDLDDIRSLFVEFAFFRGNKAEGEDPVENSSLQRLIYFRSYHRYSPSAQPVNCLGTNPVAPDLQSLQFGDFGERFFGEEGTIIPVGEVQYLTIVLLFPLVLQSWIGVVHIPAYLQQSIGMVTSHEIPLQTTANRNHGWIITI